MPKPSIALRHIRQRLVPTLITLLAALATCFFVASSAHAGPYTIAVVQGEALSGGGSKIITSERAVAGRTLKVSTAWPAQGRLRLNDTAYKILVRGTGDRCEGSPTLEVLIDDEVVLTKTFHNRSRKLGIANMQLAPGDYKISARLKNPRVTSRCRRAVYMDVIFIEKDPSPRNPSGEKMPLGDLPGWQQIFTDDFEIDVELGHFPNAVSDKWGAYPYPWRDTKGQWSSNPSLGGWYYPEKTVSIENGVLNVRLHTQYIDNANKRLVAALLPKIHGPNTTAIAGQLYGRYAIRFRADMVNGYKTAWLLWPDSRDHPHDGEIDFPEGNLTEDIRGFMHWQNATRGNQQYYARSGQSYYDWHTAVIEWEQDRVAFYLDGNLIYDASQGQSEWFDKIPNTPMHWVIQTETRLDRIVPTTADEGNVEIDWVAVWRKL